jgi:hypothetical protein
MTVQPNIVLVHGAWADGSCWSAVIERQFAARMGATTVEVPAGHLAMVSHPDETAQLIETAAKGIQAEIKWSSR